MTTKEQPQIISPGEAYQRFGVDAYHERMENGELRFRLTSPDGGGYVRTVAGDCGTWQNGHYHQNLHETYIVGKKWIILVSERDGMILFERLGENAVVTIAPLIPHNVYLPSGAEIHVIKLGETDKADWHPATKIDRLTKKLNEDEAITLSKDVLDADISQVR